MREAPIPPNEVERLAALRALQLLDTPSEERFDRITRLAARLFDVPITLVSLVDANRQWFKSCQGLPVSETPRGVSFCAHAILGDDALVVPDARLDPRFADNPLVVGEPGVRFYAGQPLHDLTGHRLGTLCLVDRRPRHLDAPDLAALRDLAVWAEREINSLEFGQALAVKQESEARLRAILDSVVDGVVTIDANGRMVSFNPAAERIFGYTAAEAVGRNVTSLMPSPYRESHDQYLARYVNGGEARVIGQGQEVVGRRKDGSVFPMDLAVSEVRLPRGRFFTGIIRDITARKRAEEILAQVTTELQAVLDAATHVAIIATDPQGVIRVFNSGAERMLGYTAQEVVGCRTPEVFHRAEEIEAHGRTLSQEFGRPIKGFDVFVERARHGDFEAREWTYLRKDGSRLTVDLVVTAVRDRQGEPTGFLGIAIDISERKAVERMKDEFVSSVSHELRTPLTSIRGALGLLAGGTLGHLPESGRRMLEVAVTNTDRLVRLINDILDMERIESGRVQLRRQAHTAGDLMLQASEVMRPMAEKAGVRIEMTENSDRLWVDSDRVIQTLTNLLSNAIKFSPPGTTIRLGAERRDVELLFYVRDQGRGIPADKRETIFGRFQQVDASDAREKGGTGLGLAICRSLVEQHGGRIWVESTPGEGSTFFFTLPRLAERTETAAAMIGDSPLVLICDDDPGWCAQAEAILKRRGYRTVAVTSGREAVEYAAANCPAVMLIDLQMPELDGWGTIGLFRAQEETRDVPVIIVSARSAGGRQPRASDGVVAWIEKPIDEECLMRAIEHVCGAA